MLSLCSRSHVHVHTSQMKSQALLSHHSHALPRPLFFVVGIHPNSSSIRKTQTQSKSKKKKRKRRRSLNTMERWYYLVTN